MFEGRGRYHDEDFAPLVPKTYDLPELPWSLAGPLERTAIAVMHLEARLAAAALRARRTALTRKAPWPLSIDGLLALRGIMPRAGEGDAAAIGKAVEVDADHDLDGDDPLASHLAEIDALLARTSKTLAGETPIPRSRSHLVYDPEVDEAENEDLWLDVVKRTEKWPAVAAAAIAWDAWTALGMYPRQPWLGLIMAESILRARGLTTHLLPLVPGYKASRYRLQGREGGVEKVEAFAMIVDEGVTKARGNCSG